jgi:hypothetical protein
MTCITESTVSNNTNGENEMLLLKAWRDRIAENIISNNHIIVNEIENDSTYFETKIREGRCTFYRHNIFIFDLDFDYYGNLSRYTYELGSTSTYTRTARVYLKDGIINKIEFGHSEDPMFIDIEATYSYPEMESMDV